VPFVYSTRKLKLNFILGNYKEDINFYGTSNRVKDFWIFPLKTGMQNDKNYTEMPCSIEGGYVCFGGTFCLQGTRLWG
jgi:hypothetical protein